MVIVPVPEPLPPEVRVQLNDSRPRVHVYLFGLEGDPPPMLVVPLPDFVQCWGQRLRTAH